MESFTTLPATARVWIYQADRAFTTIESARITGDINAFVSQWLAHKAKVIGDGALLYDRFVILAADEDKLAVSGCSIDSTVRFIKELGSKYNVNFFNRFYTCYLQDGQVKGADFDTFKKLLADGAVNDETIVFNNLVATVGAMQAQWQIPLAKSWQGRVAVPDAGLTL